MGQIADNAIPRACDQRDASHVSDRGSVRIIHFILLSLDTKFVLKFEHWTIPENILVSGLYRLTNRLCMEDVKVGNVTIPAGTNIQFDVFSIHYDPQVWGPVSPFDFYPER